MNLKPDFLPIHHAILCEIIAIIALADDIIGKREQRTISKFIENQKINVDTYTDRLKYIKNKFKNKDDMFSYFQEIIQMHGLNEDPYKQELEYICSQISFSPDGLLSVLEFNIMNYFDPSGTYDEFRENMELK